MPSLYELFLPIVQDLNTYGGNFTSHLISKSVLDAVDAGAAAGEVTLSAMRGKIEEKITAFRGLHDHRTISALFEAFYEAVFYLVAIHRCIAVCRVPDGSQHGKTPDFATTQIPQVGFEVKTLDVYDPEGTYAKAMSEGLDSKIEAEADAKKRGGVGSSARAIAPHGPAQNRREVVEQVIKKINGNIKHDQYSAFPTFLVVATRGGPRFSDRVLS
jgi:hypothetical protein